MLPEDLQTCDVFFHAWITQIKAKNLIGLLSPNDEQVALATKCFPSAVILTHTRHNWNLDDGPNHISHDVIIANNVFHYATNPDKWFDHVFRSCSEFWIQDLVIRRRGNNTELGGDGDSTRYSIGEYPEKYQLPKDRVLDYYLYDAGSFRSNSLCVNFVARLKGDL